MPNTISLGLIIITAGFLHAEAPTGIKLQVLQGRPLVDGVFVNGHGPYRFLLDTGAQTNQMDAILARSLGLQPEFRVEMVTASGSAFVGGGGGLEVSLGSVRADRQEFLYTDMTAVRQLSDRIQGVLGQEFLSRFDYLLDLHAKRLDFAPPPPEGTRVELKTMEGRPAVFTSLGWLVLDTGTDRVVVYGGSAEGGLRVRTATGFREAAPVQAKLMIEGREISHPDAVQVPPVPGVTEAGLLPGALFRAVYVSNSSGYAVLQ